MEETNTKIEEKKIESKENLADKRTKCEVYSRIVGYYRPVNQWNDGKQAEFTDRKTFVPDKKECESC
ncbi:MAG: hypothetical protein KAS04_02660 [Candidatus Aenigmarchaeota archaeon]|nr:hypothetical protein [Candidatus Aenigmarchaeota archaeon]